jgi:hypothetical protein
VRAAFVAGPSLAQEPVRLSGYNANISESSISGISSGAFMAVQFGTAWSSVIKGVGVVAGGPFWCAKADIYDFFDAYWLPLENAIGPCMTGPLADLSSFYAKADSKSAAGDIDSLRLRPQRPPDRVANPGQLFRRRLDPQRRAPIPAGDGLAPARARRHRAGDGAVSWEVVIGLETHTQLSTRSKIFVRCARIAMPLYIQIVTVRA